MYLLLSAVLQRKALTQTLSSTMRTVHSESNRLISEVWCNFKVDDQDCEARLDFNLLGSSRPPSIPI